MPTLLTNERMAPELRSRIAQSLRSDARSRVGGESSVRGSRLIRLLVPGFVLALSSILVVTYRSSRAEFRAAHTTLIEKYDRLSSPFDQKFKAKLERVDALLRDANQAYPGDVTSPRLVSASEGNGPPLSELLRAPLAYVRGPLRGFVTVANRRHTWGQAGPDGFARCLLLPARDVKESVLLRHLGSVYEPRALRDRFTNLDEAFEALAFVEGDFRERVRSARLMSEVTSLNKQLDYARLDQKVSFSRVRHLLLVLDEPRSQNVAPDFDGEAEHYVRVALIDLVDGRTLLRTRRLVSPEWISEKSRLLYSRELDSCRLATELRNEWTNAPAKTL